MLRLAIFGGVCVLGWCASPVQAQGNADQPRAESPETLARINTLRSELDEALTKLKGKDVPDRHLADAAVCAKAAEWIVRHNEFHKPEYAKHTIAALELGLTRARHLQSAPADWEGRPGRTVQGYRSDVDESFQPYALSIPDGHNVDDPRRWPLHIVLHGRNDVLTEASFIGSHLAKKADDNEAKRDFIQIEVYGRDNNAYRWAGEADVFEAFADVRRRFRIDDRRVVLHGFSMGGAGAWHLGLHHPSLWCAVGPGAGFVDFYKYTGTNQPLPSHQDAALHIYNAVDYALNAANVPILTYGGELDKQLAASTTMKQAADELGVNIEVLVGPGTGHSFHPESLKIFREFLRVRQEEGSLPRSAVRKVRFTTRTLKYHQCAWVRVEELARQYEPAIIEGEVDEKTGILKLNTRNCSVLQVDRDVADRIDIDGSEMDLFAAADGLLPGVYFESSGSGGWRSMSYDRSINFTKNLDLRKRHNLQGPIDDAFMQPFVVVKPTGTPWNERHAKWSSAVLERFEREFDKWMRGKVVVVNDADLTAEQIADKSLILFGDPSSNSVLAKIASRLPIKWTKDALTVGDVTHDPATEAVQLIHPNPLNPRRYVVLNSGHTFHEAEFRKSNAWLFPQRGDLAVVKMFDPTPDGPLDETVRAEILDGRWKLPGR